jgi:GNAT superfamily N-acetyltransferase
MISPVPVEFSAVDSDRFSVRVARARQVTNSNLTEVIDFCGSSKIDLLIARLDSRDLQTAQKMEHLGFFLADTLVYYAFDLGKRVVPDDSPKAIIRSCQDQDSIRVRAVAAAAFRDYRGHYHADPRLENKDCDEAYTSWAERSCTSREVADEVLVAEHAGSIVGFATLRMNSTDEGEGVLFGVAPEAQGLGIYRSFMINGIRWCKMRGANRMIVSTQVTNVAVQKVWCRVGFEPSHSDYTFHMWFERGIRGSA